MCVAGPCIQYIYICVQEVHTLIMVTPVVSPFNPFSAGTPDLRTERITKI